jgi:hypothetical protein
MRIFKLSIEKLLHCIFFIDIVEKGSRKIVPIKMNLNEQKTHKIIATSKKTSTTI